MSGSLPDNGVKAHAFHGSWDVDYVPLRDAFGGCLNKQDSQPTIQSKLHKHKASKGNRSVNPMHRSGVSRCVMGRVIHYASPVAALATSFSGSSFS